MDNKKSEAAMRDERIAAMLVSAYHNAEEVYHELIQAGRREDADAIMVAAQLLKRVGNSAIGRIQAARCD